MKRLFKVVIFVLPLFLFSFLPFKNVYAVFEPTLVKDINATDNEDFPSNPALFKAIGSTLYFSATNGTNGIELWKSDGTDAGTIMVKDIYVGSASSSPSNLTVVGTTLYFSATNGTSGIELWKSDGTDAGTVMVKDIYVGSASSSPSNLRVIGTTLYFSANNGTSGTELWKSDGTNAGTVRVKDIYGGSSSSSPSNLIAVGTTLYFSATNGTNGIELWKSNGTDAGTIMVKDILVGSSSSSPNNLTAVGSTLYFSATDGTNGIELWKSDGTNAGTVMVKNIYVGYGNDPSSPSYLTAVESTLYFSARDDTHGTELWKSDGSEAGTVLVKDIYPGESYGSPISSSLQSLTVVGETLYFVAENGTSGRELWKSDGTDAGTVMVKDILVGSSSSSPSNLIAVGTTLYFTANSAISGLWDNELWKSDGTDAGTVRVKDIRGGSGSSSPSNLTAVGSTLYLSADNGTYGTELWKSDGTESDTILVKNINITKQSYPRNPLSFTKVGTTLYFSATNETYGTELWKSDGTDVGTVMVKDIYVGSASSSPSNLIAVGTTLYFSATDGTNGIELWKSDGTDAGTVRVKDIRVGSSSSSPSNLTAVGSTFYFSATNGTDGIELWKSDGTDAGTVMVKNIGLTSSSSSPSNLTAVGTTLYFSAAYFTYGTELWKSDGTNAGTVRVKDIYVGSSSSSPSNFTTIGTTLYFSATNGTNGIELWKSDGTDAGTIMVKDIYVGSSSSSPSNLTAIESTLYFSATNGTNGIELWKSNGTDAGTIMVKDIRVGSVSSSPSNLTAVGSTLYFSANNGTSGTELWKSDGTDAGTIMVKDIYVGSSSSSPSNLTTVESTLYFSAKNETGGSVPGLWELDLDLTPPIGSIYINNDSVYTSSTSVSLTLYATDSLSTAPSMIVCEDDSFANCNWETYDTSKSWDFSDVQGTKTIYVKFKDSEGNESESYSDSIIYDSQAPIGSASIDSGNIYTTNPNVSLTLTASDSISGVSQMTICNDSSFTDCNWEDYSSTKSWTLLEGQGTKTVYAKYMDESGLISEVYSDSIIYDSQAPIGSASIDSGNIYTTNPNVSLTLTASDSISGVSQMTICNDSSFTDCNWEDYSSTKSWTLLEGQGTKTVYAKYMDDAGNISEVFLDDISVHSPSILITEIGLVKDIPNRSPYTMYFTSQTPLIKGITQPNSTVSFVYGTTTYTTKADSSGNFSITLTVSRGSNTIQYYSKDISNNVSVTKTLTLIVGTEYFPDSLLERLGLIPSTQDVTEHDEETEQEDTPSQQEDTPSEDIPQKETETGIQSIQFLDEQGNPMVSALIQIDGMEYYTDGNGKIQVYGLEEGKNYKVSIEYEGNKYQTEVLGEESTEGSIQVRVTQGDILKGMDWKKILMYGGVSLFVIFFLILIFKRRKNEDDTQNHY